MKKISISWLDILPTCYWDTRRKILNKINHIQQAYLFYKRGYTSMDWFELASNNAERNIKCLKHLRDHGAGYPCGDNSRESWEHILSEMIFAWEEVLYSLSPEIAREICDKDRFSFITKHSWESNGIFDDEPTHIITSEKDYVLRHYLVEGRDIYKKYNWYQVQTRENYDRMVNGFKLYIEYYAGLWD